MSTDQYSTLSNNVKAQFHASIGYRPFHYLFNACLMTCGNVRLLKTNIIIAINLINVADKQYACHNQNISTFFSIFARSWATERQLQIYA